MKIAVLQFAPVLADVQGNIQRADELLARCLVDNVRENCNAHCNELPQATKIDLLVLPELAFAGYNHTPTSIKAVLEARETGVTGQWAKRTAAKYKCCVSVGYAEYVGLISDHPHLRPPESGNESTSLSEQDELMLKLGPWPGLHESFATEVNFNSSITVCPDGEVVAHHRKRHLYYTDETWARESGFAILNGAKGDWQAFNLPLSDHPSAQSRPTTLTTFGICMDVNPYKFLPSRWAEREFARSAANQHAALVVVNTAWLSSAADETEVNPNGAVSGDSVAANGTIDDNAMEPDEQTLLYWMDRLTPLIQRDHRAHVQAPSDTGVICVFANRTGREPGSYIASAAGPNNSNSGVRYCGTSWIGHTKGDGTMEVWGVMGRDEEGVLVVDTSQYSTRPQDGRESAIGSKAPIMKFRMRQRNESSNDE